MLASKSSDYKYKRVVNAVSKDFLANYLGFTASPKCVCNTTESWVQASRENHWAPKGEQAMSLFSSLVISNGCQWGLWWPGSQGNMSWLRAKRASQGTGYCTHKIISSYANKGPIWAILRWHLGKTREKVERSERLSIPKRLLTPKITYFLYASLTFQTVLDLLTAWLR